MGAGVMGTVAAAPVVVLAGGAGAPGVGVTESGERQFSSQRQSLSPTRIETFVVHHGDQLRDDVFALLDKPSQSPLTHPCRGRRWSRRT